MEDVSIIKQVAQLISEGRSYSYIFRVTGISPKTVKRYKALIEKEGEGAILRQGNRYYQTADKAGAVLAVLNNGESLSSVAARIGATESSIREWCKKYETGGIEALKDRRRLRRGYKTISQEDYEMLAALKESTNNK